MALLAERIISREKRYLVLARRRCGRWSGGTFWEGQVRGETFGI